MQKRRKEFEYLVYDSFDGLPSDDQVLMQAAVEARKKAYAPYSKFHVGAAVLLGDGKTVIGNNQENASYPAGVCAERVALLQAAAKFPEVQIMGIAISASSKMNQVDRPVTSCGICRQTMAEYEQRQQIPIPILMMGEIGPVIKCDSVLDLIPLAFDSSYL